MGRVYATPTDYEDWSGEPAPDGIERRLVRASNLVELATRTAVYDVTPAGLPSDPDIAEAFRDAVCEQAAAWPVTGDELGDAGRWQSVSIGRVNLSRAGSGGGGSTPRERLAPNAAAVLAAAGLLGQPIAEPATYY